ncbi:MAG: hypothetical protein AAF938_04650 [Myxococcota bacterium]
MLRRIAFSLVFLVACGDDSSVTPLPDSSTDGATDAAGDEGTGDEGTGDEGTMDASADLRVEDLSADGPAIEAGVDAAADAALDAPIDAMDAAADSAVDARADADAAMDAATDAAMDADPVDASDACHDLTFGGEVVSFERVDAFARSTGGTIPLGVYDAVAARTTGRIEGTYRGTWNFTSDSTLELLEQITLSGRPPTPTPRTLEYRTGANQLTRAQVCGGDTVFMNEYSVRITRDRTVLEVTSGTIQFEFELRR